ERTPEELAGLLRRLASGLGAAHKLGAIHRDMSPDNVLLPGGDVHQAKIIDFGIATDLDSSSATIVGDGFAGKLNYVAPEQLGDYGREVGPWTDVYSLALVILAVANGKNVNMSGSLVDAIDKRRKGPDISAIPDSLRPTIEAMLRPDPKDRLRSMEDVVAMLGGGSAPPVTIVRPETTESQPAGGGGASKALLVGGVLAAALAVGGGAYYLMGGEFPGGGGDPRNIVGPVTPGPPANPVEAARGAINAVIPSVSCTWLDIGSVTDQGGTVTVAMRGVAGDAQAAQRELNSALQQAGVANARLDFGDVAPITPAGCAALDTYRQVRATSDYRLSTERPRFEMTMQPAGSAYAGEEAANAVIDFDFTDPNIDFAIVGIEPSGVISAIIADRANFEGAVAQSVGGRPISSDGNGRYRLHIDLDHQGWSGIILVTGQGPFPPDVIAPPVGARGPSWQQDFLSQAAQRNWRVEMVWFQSVNREGSNALGATPAAN
ncbi:MAG: serine/threonine-protein kinase, partial [Sphingosinicella sp.]|uniref:serine/threonine-protein kinase n=1 Tax=Sphingosinicella sp. TaxID=1917971 RepID=UPI004037AA86